MFYGDAKASEKLLGFWRVGFRGLINGLALGEADFRHETVCQHYTLIQSTNVHLTTEPPLSL